MRRPRGIRLPIRRAWRPVTLVSFLLAMGACGDRSGAADRQAERAVAGLPVYPGSQAATELRRSMLRAWVDAGEPSARFEDRFGEHILWTDDSWEEVRAFYRVRAARVLMDHEMEFPDVGRQKMLTGLIQLADGSIVKFTATRPFFRYPDQEPVDRTVIQMGRLVSGSHAH